MAHSRFTRFRRSVWVAALLVVVFLPLRTDAETPQELRPQGYVNDFAGVLSANTNAQLGNLCREVDHKADAQIAIVTVKSLEGETSSDFAVNLAQRWGVGPKQKDRGVLILLAPADHQYWITVGYGLEGILPDGKVGGFGREMVPFLRQNDYGGAVLLLTRRIAQVIADDRGITLTGAPGLRLQPAPSLLHIMILGIIVSFSFGLPIVVLILRFLFGIWRPVPRLPIGGPWGGASNSWRSSGSGDSGSSWRSSRSGGGDSGFGGGGFGGGGAGGSW